MFGINSGEPVPHEMHTNYEAWDAYMGHLWYNLLFFANLKKSGVVIEVAPGSSCKIAQALAKVNFSGTLYVIEPQVKIAKIIRENYKNWLPNATIFVIEELLENALDKLPYHADTLVSNHPLDDMLLSAHLAQSEINELFDWASDMPSATFDSTISTWSKIRNDPEQLAANINHTYETWQTVLERLKPQTVILSQYPSFMMESMNLNQLNQYAWKLLQRLRDNNKNHLVSDQFVQAILNSHKNYNDEHFGLEILNAKNWLMINFN